MTEDAAGVGQAKQGLPATVAASAPQYGLRLAEVRVQDFRALQHVSVRLGKSTVLVGENNSGKTSFLDAIAVALGDRRPRIEDLHRCPERRATTFVVDLRIEPAIEDEFSNAVRDVLGDAVRLEEGRCEFVTLRVTGAVGEDGADMVLRRSFVSSWASERVAAAALPVLKSPAVGREALGLLHFEMLDARRDIVEQLRLRRSHWGKIAASHDVVPTLRATIETSLKALGEEVTENSAVLRDARANLHDLSSALSGGVSVEIEALPHDLDDLIRAMDIIINAPESSPFAIAEQGMGTRSLAALLVFRSYVNVVRAKKQADRVLSISAFEEPEAHLHPQAQRSVFGILSGIAGQKVISTHSAHVASVADILDYRLFRRLGAATAVSQLGESTTSKWGDLTQTRRFVLQRHPDVFFARAVAIVEGETEAAAFPIFAQNHWGDRGADGQGVSLVCTAGAGSSKHIIPLLEALSIPWVIFCDGDGAGDRGLAATSAAIGRPLDRTSPEVVQLPAGEALEDHLLNTGFQDHCQRTADRHPEGPLAQYRTRLDGQRRKGGAPRDYHSAGWERRVIADFLATNKGTVGALLANEICIGGVLPPLVRDFFDRIDKLRRRT